ncbi:protein brambleberry-like [Prorops nasuta]|uniref:protein brambleberry-like n=1 Tax=Prorops nasuta TaxID=863751 RepID=UPI0034CD4B69
MELAFVVLLFTINISQSQSATVLNWIWGKSEDDNTAVVADGVPLINIPYETMTEDEKFLQEAAKFTDIQVSSPLETCQHKVVMKIKTSCSDMTEEELAKLSVNLLNCQSAVEGRKMFPCTEEMSLKQCTTDMDADMWNAYHLMSNRARAVCYAARSTQFRALTELTVNKLMQSAHSQIKTLDSLKEGQERLELQTIEALHSLSEGNQVLMQQQTYLKDAQISAHNLVTTNLRELNNEKALIRAGHAQLVVMTEDIKKKLEKANEELLEQAQERGANHKEVLEDLMSIQEQALTIWDKIEASTDRILEQHETAAQQYEQTLKKLTQINETIQYILDATTNMRSEIDEKLGWITDYIGDTGEQLQRVYRIFLHVLYLMVAMVVAAFLNAPIITRITLLGLIPLNLATYLKHGLDGCLDFPSITVLIFLITGMHFVMSGIQYFCGPKTLKTLSKNEQNVMSQNGTLSDKNHQHTSSSYNYIPKKSLYVRIKNTFNSFFNGIVYQLNHATEIIGSFVEAATLWSKRSLTSHEELSCSYVPSKKSRADLLYDYGKEYLSDDATEAEISDKLESYNSFDNLVDASELRRRFLMDAAKYNSRKIPTPTTRSPSPSYSSPRTPCVAFTRNGKRCRLYATIGSNYCSRHNIGSSVMGD